MTEKSVRADSPFKEYEEVGVVELLSNEVMTPMEVHSPSQVTNPS
jgi:hypothetical protein